MLRQHTSSYFRVSEEFATSQENGNESKVSKYHYDWVEFA